MEIKEIKQQLTIGQVLDYYGFTPDKHHRLKCPWHHDKTPSLQIFPKTDSWTCFSSNCNAGSGDAIGFIERMEGQGKHQAIMKAKELLGMLSEAKSRPIVSGEGDKHKGILVAQSLASPGGSVPPTQQGQVRELSRIAVLSKVSQEGKASFKKTAKARDYIQSRGLAPERTEAGYIGPGMGKSWNEALQQSGLKLGLLKTSGQKTVVPKFKHCVVFFMNNSKGQVVGLYGRSVDEKAELKHLYLNGAHQGLYPGYPKEATTKLVLTESIIDCATLQQCEAITQHYSLLALYGTNGFTPHHQEAISQLKGLQEVVLFFDGDEAGKAAIGKTGAKVQQIRPGVTITAVPTPEGEDVNSLLQGHEPEILTHLLKERKPVHLSTETKEGQDKEAGPHHSLPRPDGNQGSPCPVLDTGNPDKVLYRSGELRFTVWGGIDINQLHRLKINLHVQLKGNGWKYYQDDVNLYSNSQLVRYIKGASQELEASSTGLKQSIQQLKHQIENYRLQKREDRQKALRPKPYPMTAQEEKEALALLKNKQLVKKTMEAITGAGLVGEQKNGLLLFFLYLTRLFEEPLHAIIFGKSGSGKTYLQTKVSECLPEESVRTITSLSENVLYYSPKGFWQHVVLVIEDLDGVYQALLALRELMSKQSITKYTTDKDAQGNNIQKTLTVEGPVSVSGATTKEAIYEDNANRSFLLYVDESTSHTQQVMDYQRKARAGMINGTNQEASKLLLKNAQRLLDKRIKVYNPYALQLKLPQAIFKPLRTNEHYLKLIEVIAFYHQKQREVKTHPQTKERYIEVALKDIEIANRLVKESLLRKSDELNGEFRQFFEYLKDHVSRHRPKDPEATFYAKNIRKERRLHPMKLARYLSGLERRGYIKWTGGSKRTGYEYQVTAWEEYGQLREGMHLLDKILEGLKAGETPCPGPSEAKT